MAASVTIKEANGAGPAYTTVDDGANPARFCNADNNAPVLATPCVIATGGVGNLSYSFWKHFFLDLSGSYTRINNVVFYCDGTIGWALGTAGEVRIGLRDAGDNGLATTDYDQSTGTTSTGDDMENGASGHAYYKGQGTPSADVSSYVTGSALTIDSANHDGAAEKTKGCVMQTKVDGDATRGEQTDETFTFRFDEIALLLGIGLGGLLAAGYGLSHLLPLMDRIAML